MEVIKLLMEAKMKENTLYTQKKIIITHITSRMANKNTTKK